jgi:hypothetical protein
MLPTETATTSSGVDAKFTASGGGDVDVTPEAPRIGSKTSQKCYTLCRMWTPRQQFLQEQSRLPVVDIRWAISKAVVMQCRWEAQ